MRTFPLFIFIQALLVAGWSAEPPRVSPPVVVLPAEIVLISPQEVPRQLVAHPETLIIDLRTEEERSLRGHILNSLHHDYFHGRQTLDALDKLDKNAPCLLYCAIGGRAKLAALEMRKMGFKNILLLKGGFDAWTAAGQAVAK